MAATCSYNGISFLSMYRSKVSFRPILDEAQRTTVYVEHSLDVEGYVQSDSGTGTTLASIRKLLSACAGTLTYQDKGFGDLVVNTGSVWDVKWGPIPEVVDWVPLGGDGRAARVHWRCTTRIPECDAAKYKLAILAFNWEISHDFDNDGYATENVSGYLEIPMTRTAQSNRNPPDSVDRYREQLEQSVPLGFHRRNQKYRISSDRRRIDFSWSDQEVSDPLMPKTTKMDLEYTVRAPMPYVKWTIGLSGSVTVARGVPKVEALTAFLKVWESRIAVLRKTKGVTVIPTDIYISEQVFGRTSRFSYGALVTMPNAKPATFLLAAKVWFPVDGTDYGKWRTSLYDAKQSQVRGYSGLKYKPEYDLIVDLCMTPGEDLVQELVPIPPQQKTGPTDANLVNESSELRRVKPETSNLDYRMRTELLEEQNVMRHQPLPTKKPQGDTTDNARRINATLDDADMRRQVGGIGASQGDMPDEVYQQASPPARRFRLVGSSVRVGYRTPVPKVESLGGVTVTEEGRHVTEEQIGAIGGTPIFRTAWLITYAVPRAPSALLPTTANPALETDSTQGTNELEGVTR